MRGRAEKQRTDGHMLWDELWWARVGFAQHNNQFSHKPHIAHTLMNTGKKCKDRISQCPPSESMELGLSNLL